MNQEVGFEFLARLVHKYWQVIVGMMILGVMIAAGLTFFVMKPQYQSSIQILVNRKQTNAATDYAGQQADVQMITTYKELITNPVVLNPAKQLLDAGADVSRSVADLKQSVSVTNTTDSQVFSITVKDRNAKASALIADQIAKSFKTQVSKIIKVNNVTIVAPAEVPHHTVSPHKLVNLLIGLIIGLMLGVFYACLRMLTDRRIHDVEFITDDLELVSLGLVNHQPHTSQHKQAKHLSSGQPETAVVAVKRV